MVMKKCVRLMTIGVASHQTSFGLQLLNLNEQNKDYIRNGATGFRFVCDANGEEQFYASDDDDVSSLGIGLTFQFVDDLNTDDEEIQHLYAKNKNIARFMLNHNRLNTGMRFINKVLQHYNCKSIDNLLCLPESEQERITRYIYKNIIGQLPPKYVDNDMLSLERGRLLFYEAEDISAVLHHLQYGDLDIDQVGEYGRGIYFYDRTYRPLEEMHSSIKENILVAKLSNSAKVVDIETLMAIQGLLLPDKMQYLSKNNNCSRELIADAKKFCQFTKMWTVLAYLAGFDALTAPIGQKSTERYLIPLVKNKIILPSCPRLSNFLGCKYDIITNMQIKI